ncbi:MAG: HEPN domain-containing protein [Armatimonadota bacterium]
MPHNPIEPGSAKDWLRHAASDLAVASEANIQGVLPQTLCFHAQQAVEKSLKAVLVHLGCEYPLTHVIARLITLIKQQGIDWPDELDAAADLTIYAVQLRYPGANPEIAQEEYDEAVDIAKCVMEWAGHIVDSA